MSNVMHPRGPQPPSVYWRRRAVALVVLLLVLLLLFTAVRAIAGMFGGSDASSKATTSPAASAPSTSASASASPSGGAACEAASLRITPTTAAKSVKVGQATKVGMTIENIGAQPCNLDAGSGNLELLVSSGAERIWSSDDCQKAGESRPTDVAAGAKLESTVPWEVNRSAKGCPSDLAAIKPGTYNLKARVGDITSEALSFTVTG